MTRTNGWERLLVLDGGHTAIWQSPTGRFFTGTTHPTTLSETGFTRLEDALRQAATDEAKRQELTVRDVLWRTQPTQSYIRAELRVQRAFVALLTNLNPVRARFASLRAGSFDHDR